MKKKTHWAVLPSRCTCHPETCSCPDYEIWLIDKDGNYTKRVAGGMDRKAMERLCQAANDSI